MDVILVLVMLVLSRSFVLLAVSLLLDVRRLVRLITVLLALSWVLSIFYFLYI